MCPLELCSTEPLLWGKGPLPWEGACPLPVSSSGAALATGCSPWLAGRLLLVAELWGTGEGTAETPVWSCLPSEPSTFPNPLGLL